MSHLRSLFGFGQLLVAGKEEGTESEESTYKTMSSAPWPIITFCVRSITPGSTVIEDGNEESPPTKTSPLAHSSHSIFGALIASWTSVRLK